MRREDENCSDWRSGSKSRTSGAENRQRLANLMINLASMHGKRLKDDL